MKAVSTGEKERDDLFLEHLSASKKQQNLFEPSGRHQPTLGWFPSAGF